MDDSNPMISQYLDQLDKVPLLTLEEEQNLVKKIEILQQEILLKCSSNFFFKDELLTILNSYADKDITKVSKKVDDSSSKKEKSKAKKHFTALLEELIEPRTEEKLRESVNKAFISGNIINSVVTKIKKKYSKIKSCNAKRNKLLKFFEIQKLEDKESALKELIELIKDDDSYRRWMVVKYETSESTLMSKVYDYSQYQNDVKALEDLGLSLDDLEEFIELYDTILKFELEMKQYKDELVTRNLRLVVSRAKYHIGKGLEFEDLIQAGNIGLIKAINKYDLSRGAKISTYATWWIDQSIRRTISNEAKTVRIPTHIEFLQTKIAAAITHLTKELNRPPKLPEIAEHMEVPLKTLEGLQQRAMYEVGIDEELSSGAKLIDILPSDGTDDPFNVTAKKLMREKIRMIISSLSPRTEKIIRLRYGIGEPYEELTLEQIANKIGVTRAGVGVIEKKAFQEIGDGLDD